MEVGIRVIELDSSQVAPLSAKDGLNGLYESEIALPMIPIPDFMKVNGRRRRAIVDIEKGQRSSH
jgi:hypothetical protein